MSFFDDILALSPAVFWKLNEAAAAATAADATGNGRTGTIPVGITLEEDSMIPAEPDDTAGSNAGGNNTFVSRNNEAWMNPGASFTALVVLRPSSLAAQRDVIGKVDSWQLWMQTSGQLTGHISPAWTSFNTANTPEGKVTAGDNFLVVMRKDAGVNLASIWINGVKVGEAAHSSTLTNSSGQLRMFGASTGANRAFPGRQQALAYWPGVALTDTQIEDLYTSFLTPPSPPVDPPEPPGAFLAPLAGAQVSGGYAVVWGASPSENAEVYELERWDGVEWVPLATSPVNSYVWDTSALEQIDAQLQVRAVDETNDLASDWVTSGLFDIVPLPPDRKAWAFTLDGHIFYVLGVYAGRTLLCDLVTGQWCLWKTKDLSFWNMHRGAMWRGKVLAADIDGPVIWELDPDAPDDAGDLAIERVVTGFLESNYRGSRRIGAARLTASVGEPNGADVYVTLRFSDDEGETWSNPKQVLLRADAFDQELKFRSLGRLVEPGRLWEISDAGGLVRIDGLDIDIDEVREMPQGQ